MLWLAEEVGLVGGQQIDHLLQFIGMLAGGQQPIILGVGVKSVMFETAAEAADEQHSLGIRQADAGQFVDQPLEERELLVGDRGFRIVHRPSE
ncbi:MAG: hypothetical protein AW09_003905 [Candidatus Accumulibacter phosphatis]|uniref:Uncharacterized protein n=1 Tax=Candidatus Accumulibacter phosphatis TaxID=327160 RepID=A0A080LTQ3_9PROT|nr:MAG: hypothetical protein AW09_003905 [Candidatus Accumulibacter phosphatis]